MRISNNIFDQGIFWLVMLLAVLPFGQILHVRLPGVTLNAFELIWVSMLGILEDNSENINGDKFLDGGYIDCIFSNVYVESGNISIIDDE